MQQGEEPLLVKTGNVLQMIEIHMIFQVHLPGCFYYSGINKVTLPVPAIPHFNHLYWICQRITMWGDTNSSF